MRKLILALLFVTFSAFANQADPVADTYHQRLVAKFPQAKITEIRKISIEDVPAEILNLRKEGLQELLDFATDLDLFAIGWSYESHPNIYQAVNESGEVILYTFSTSIIKDDMMTARRIYQADRRVDGVFYIGRVSDYNL